MLRAVAGTLVISTLPGLLVAVILGLRLRVLSTWAAIPAFSLSIVFVLGEVELLFGAPFGPIAFIVLLVVLAAGAVIAVRARDRRPGADTDADAGDGEVAPADTAPNDRGRPRVLDAIDHALLVVGIAIGSVIWGRGLRGVPMIPPGGDATRHGFFVARIIAGQTIDSAKVVTWDGAGHHAAANYYPLALHASAALVSRFAGADVASVLIAYTLIFSIVVWPVGMFVLARALAPGRPLVGGFTALLAPLLVLFPYAPAWAGEIPLIVAMTLVPIAVVFVARAATDRRSHVPVSDTVVAVVVAALAVLSITATHQSELPVVVILAVLLVLEDALIRRDARALGRSLGRGILVAGVTLVLFAPTVGAFARGVSERTSLSIRADTGQSTFAAAREALFWLHYSVSGSTTITPRQGVLAVVAIAGALIWLAWRRVAWVAGWIVVAILMVIAIRPEHGLGYGLTFPWYHQPWRVGPNLAYFVPLFAGAALAAGSVMLARLVRRPRTTAVAALAVAAAALLVVGLPAYTSGTRFLHASFEPGSNRFFNQALVGPSTLRGFRWLHDHVPAQDTVVNEPTGLDGSLWMYNEEGVNPLIAVTFVDKPPELRDRLYVPAHLKELGSDAKVDALVRHYRARWVFFDERGLIIGPRVLNLAELRANPHLKVAFHDDTTWIFKIAV